MQQCVTLKIDFEWMVLRYLHTFDNRVADPKADVDYSYLGTCDFNEDTSDGH